MTTQIQAVLSLAAATIAMSAALACAPASYAQVPQTGGVVNQAPVASAEPPRAPPPPPTEAECHALASKVMVTPLSADVDVKPQYDAFFLAQQEKFRCCFDALYAPKVPRTDGQVVLFVKVEASGKLASSEIVASESTAQGPEMNACILDVAKVITYPKPAGNAMIGYKRTFQFKAHR